MTIINRYTGVICQQIIPPIHPKGSVPYTPICHTIRSIDTSLRPAADAAIIIKGHNCAASDILLGKNSIHKQIQMNRAITK